MSRYIHHSGKVWLLPRLLVLFLLLVATTPTVCTQSTSTEVRKPKFQSFVMDGNDEPVLLTVVGFQANYPEGQWRVYIYFWDKVVDWYIGWLPYPWNEFPEYVVAVTIADGKVIIDAHYHDHSDEDLDTSIVGWKQAGPGKNDPIFYTVSYSRYGSLVYYGTGTVMGTVFILPP